MSEQDTEQLIPIQESVVEQQTEVLPSSPQPTPPPASEKVTTLEQPLPLEQMSSKSAPTEQSQSPEPTAAQPASPPPVDQQSVQSVQPKPYSTASSEPQPNPLGQTKSFLAKAIETIRFRRKAKLEKIIKLAQEKKSITNDDVEKLLHVSDATATRYLVELVGQNRLKRTGVTATTKYEPN